MVFVAFTITSMLVRPPTPFSGFVTADLVGKFLEVSEVAFSRSEVNLIPDSNLSVPLVFYCVIILNTNVLSFTSGMKLYVTFLSSFENEKRATDCTYEYRMNAILFFQIAMSILTLCAEGQFIKNRVNDILIWKPDWPA